MTAPQTAAAHLTDQLEKRLLALTRDHRLLIQDLIGVVDFVDGWMHGVSDTERSRCDQLRQRLLHVLLQHGVRPTARAGSTLDLRYHEVIGVVPANGVPPDTIMDIVLMGYELLAPGFAPATLRQAKVCVASEENAMPNGDAA